MLESTPVPPAEDEVCAVTADVLAEVVGDQAPLADDLTIGFRILSRDYGRATLNVAPGRTEGEGFGPAEQQWLTTIALNLVSMLIWVGLEKGWSVLRDEHEFQKLRTEIVSGAGRAQAWVERMIDRARALILGRHP